MYSSDGLGAEKKCTTKIQVKTDVFATGVDFDSTRVKETNGVMFVNLRNELFPFFYRGRT